MGSPFVSRGVEDCDVADCELGEGLGEGGVGAEGGEEGVVAVCYGGVVEEGEV